MPEAVTAPPPETIAMRGHAEGGVASSFDRLAETLASR